MRRRLRDDGGAVTAEVAVVLPIVALIIAVGAGVLGVSATRVRLEDAAADAARVLSRGESIAQARGVVSRAAPGAALAVDRPNALVCATATVSTRIALGLPVALRARSCALDGGG